MKTVILSTAAAVVALTATVASAENAVSQARARLDAEFAKIEKADQGRTSRGERQVTSGAGFGLFDSIFGNVEFGVADSGRLDAGSFAGVANRPEVRAGR